MKPRKSPQINRLSLRLNQLLYVFSSIEKCLTDFSSAYNSSNQQQQKTIDNVRSKIKELKLRTSNIKAQDKLERFATDLLVFLNKDKAPLKNLIKIINNETIINKNTQQHFFSLLTSLSEITQSITSGTTTPAIHTLQPPPDSGSVSSSNIIFKLPHKEKKRLPGQDSTPQTASTKQPLATVPTPITTNTSSSSTTTTKPTQTTAISALSTATDSKSSSSSSLENSLPTLLPELETLLNALVIKIRKSNINDKDSVINDINDIIQKINSKTNLRAITSDCKKILPDFIDGLFALGIVSEQEKINSLRLLQTIAEWKDTELSTSPNNNSSTTSIISQETIISSTPTTACVPATLSTLPISAATSSAPNTTLTIINNDLDGDPLPPNYTLPATTDNTPPPTTPIPHTSASTTTTTTGIPATSTTAVTPSDQSHHQAQTLLKDANQTPTAVTAPATKSTKQTGSNLIEIDPESGCHITGSNDFNTVNYATTAENQIPTAPIIVSAQSASSSSTTTTAITTTTHPTTTVPAPTTPANQLSEDEKTGMQDISGILTRYQTINTDNDQWNISSTDRRRNKTSSGKWKNHVYELQNKMSNGNEFTKDDVENTLAFYNFLGSAFSGGERSTLFIELRSCINKHQDLLKGMLLIELKEYDGILKSRPKVNSSTSSRILSNFFTIDTHKLITSPEKIAAYQRLNNLVNATPPDIDAIKNEIKKPEYNDGELGKVAKNIRNLINNSSSLEANQRNDNKFDL